MTIWVAVIEIVIIVMMEDHSHDNGNYFNDDYYNNAIM